MRALVVYESMFGNTEEVANAIADGLLTNVDVDVVGVGSAPHHLDDGVALVVVGAPTHGFGMSRPSTREDARDRGAEAARSEIGVREWLVGLEAPSGALAAAFDTRVARPRMLGSAARAAMRHLRRAGFGPAARPASFFVEGVGGPLLPGELDRARAWGTNLAAAAAPVGARG